MSRLWLLIIDLVVFLNFIWFQLHMMTEYLTTHEEAATIDRLINNETNAALAYTRTHQQFGLCDVSFPVLCFYHNRITTSVWRSLKHSHWSALSTPPPFRLWHSKQIDPDLTFSLFTLQHSFISRLTWSETLWLVSSVQTSVWWFSGDLLVWRSEATELIC